MLVFSVTMRLLLLLVILVLGSGDLLGTTGSCTSNSSLVGFTADLSMIQHQLRGTILILDDCTFQVTKFDMLAGTQVYWWGAMGKDFKNMTTGHPISDQMLNKTYSNSTLYVTLNNYTWTDFRVLSIWDMSTASDFGHIVLEPASLPDVEAAVPQVAPPTSAWSPSPFPSESLPPSPAPVPSMQGPGIGTQIIRGASQPTMFDNCAQLSSSLRLRWTVNWGHGTVDIGLETVLAKSEYISFGWASVFSSAHYMVNSDVVIAGFDEQDMPYAEDYFISAYKTCNWDVRAPNGVCPDSLFPADKNKNGSDTTLIHGQQVDGISLIRYSRPIESSDSEYDVSIDLNANMRVVWAKGVMKPPDSLIPHYTPQSHAMKWGDGFGYKQMILGDTFDECIGPLPASDVYQGEIVVADRGSSLVIGAVDAKHYPNPPSPQRVLSINQKEAPLLKVERGVPVKLSVQAGHDVPFYITSDAIGGSSNPNETIFAGGSEAHGVPVIPHLLTWLPNSSTPDYVYYQSFSQPKMGWKVQVVDGGLSDMYNSSASLDGEQVTLFWTLSGDEISFAVRGEQKSGYVAIGFGSGMVNSFAYVGWIDTNEVGRVSTYWIDGKEAAKVHATSELLTEVKCSRQDGRITFEFTRPLLPSCVKGKACKNVIDPNDVLKVVWAMGSQWTEDSLAYENMHFLSSNKPLLVYLTTGEAKPEELVPVFAVHGFMMFLAWGLLFPGGVLAARYLKHLEHEIWFQVHIFSQYSGIVVMLLGLLFAVAELGGIHMSNAHMKVGMISILLACWQPMNAYFRPKKVPFGESQNLERVVWEYLHIYSGRAAMLMGGVALITGISQLGETEDISVAGYRWALVAWFFSLAAAIAYLETREFKHRKQQQGVVYNSWTNTETDEVEEEDMSRTLLQTEREEKEIQLFPLRGAEPRTDDS